MVHEESLPKVRLGDIASEITVGHVGPMASEYVEDGIPFLRSQNVEPYRINLSDVKFISPSFHARLRKSALCPGDVVIVRTGKPGAASVVPSSLPVSNCSDLVIVRTGPKLDAQFLAYYINTAASHHVDAHLVGAVQQHFNVGSARTLEIRLPNLSGQRAIVNVLGSLDNKIDLNRRMNETLEAIARTLFRSWFVNFDPVRAKQEGRQPPGLDAATAALFPSGYNESEIGPIPISWCVGSVYDRATYTNGSTFRNEQFSPKGQGLPVIKIGELKNGITDQTKFTEDSLNEKYRVHSGEILFSWSGSPDTSIDTFVWCGVEGWLNQHIFKVTTKKPEEKLFVFYLLRYLKLIFVEIARNKQTTGLGHVTAQDLRRLKVVVPPAKIMAEFNRRVGPIFDKTYLNMQESRTLATLRDTLLPKLLSGEIRVKDAEKLMESA